LLHCSNNTKKGKPGKGKVEKSGEARGVSAEYSVLTDWGKSPRGNPEKKNTKEGLLCFVTLQDRYGVSFGV